jgi:hypothetical protein
MNPSKVPHRKVSIGAVTYYVAKYPEGDAFIHKSYRTDKQGYAGRTIKFLTSDGSYESVVGPYFCSGVYEHGDSKKVADELNEPFLAYPATRLTVGYGLSWCNYVEKQEIIEDEKSFVHGDYRERLSPLWSGLNLQIHLRGGSRFIRLPNIHNDYRYLWE